MEKDIATLIFETTRLNHTESMDLAIRVLARVRAEEEEADTVRRFLKRGWLPPEQAQIDLEQANECIAALERQVEDLESTIDDLIGDIR